MTLATWIIAVASIITAATDTVVTIRHSRTDNIKFSVHNMRITSHDRRITKLENGAPK